MCGTHMFFPSSVPGLLPLVLASGDRLQQDRQTETVNDAGACRRDGVEEADRWKGRCGRRKGGEKSQ